MATVYTDMATVYTDTLVKELMTVFVKALTAGENDIQRIASKIAQRKIVDSYDMNELETAGKVTVSAERVCNILADVYAIEDFASRNDVILSRLSNEITTGHMQMLLNP